MYVVALTGGHAALTPWVIGYVGKAVGTQFLSTHAIWELSCSRYSSLFYFFLLVIDPHDFIT